MILVTYCREFSISCTTIHGTPIARSPSSALRMEYDDLSFYANEQLDAVMYTHSLSFSPAKSLVRTVELFKTRFTKQACSYYCCKENKYKTKRIKKELFIFLVCLHTERIQ